MSILIVDGVRYNCGHLGMKRRSFILLVRRCYKEIFGEDSLYFDVKHMSKTVSGIGSIPDAYVIDLANNNWYVVEMNCVSLLAFISYSSVLPNHF